MDKVTFQKIRFSVPWNLFSLTIGAIIFVAGINGIVVHQSFIPGGLYGLCLFVSYKTEIWSPGILYLLFNIPFFILGWILVSRRFVLYTIYMIRKGRREEASRRSAIELDPDFEAHPTLSVGQAVLNAIYILVGLGLLVLGAQLLVDSAVKIATEFERP